MFEVSQKQRFGRYLKENVEQIKEGKKGVDKRSNQHQRNKEKKKLFLLSMM